MPGRWENNRGKFIPSGDKKVSDETDFLFHLKLNEQEKSKDDMQKTEDEKRGEEKKIRLKYIASLMKNENKYK